MQGIFDQIRENQEESDRRAQEAAHEREGVAQQRELLAFEQRQREIEALQRQKAEEAEEEERRNRKALEPAAPLLDNPLVSFLAPNANTDGEPLRRESERLAAGLFDELPNGTIPNVVKYLTRQWLLDRWGATITELKNETVTGRRSEELPETFLARTGYLAGSLCPSSPAVQLGGRSGVDKSLR